MRDLLELVDDESGDRLELFLGSLLLRLAESYGRKRGATGLGSTASSAARDLHPPFRIAASETGREEFRMWRCAHRS